MLRHVRPSSEERAAVSGVRLPPCPAPDEYALFQTSSRSPVAGMRRSVVFSVDS